MKNERNLQPLLNDLLHPADEQTLQRMLREVKLRRYGQHTAVVSLLVLFALCVTTWRRPVAFHEQAKAPEPGITVTISEPLPASMIVSSRPDNFGVISSSIDSVAMIDTEPAQNLFRQITEQELLALVQGHPVGLVWNSGPRNPNFLLLDPADQDGFTATVH